jgi:Ca2+-transporting ATPase
VSAASPEAQPGDGAPWYSLSADDVAKQVGADATTGLTAAEAQARLAKDGPNALPTEKPTPEWRRFLGEYRTFMQIVLVAAGGVSLVIAEWSTAILLFALTVLNAVVGMREEGKAESAMNALKSMMKATARVRRDDAEAKLPAEQLVAGDVGLLAAGDQVPADGRIVAASALQIDESALTGESTPRAKSADVLSGDALTAGDQTNMAFMNTPVTHGSGTMIVTATGKDTEVGKISGLLTATPKEDTPLMRQLTRMTQWIAVAALVTMVVMFALGMARGDEWRSLFVTAVALAIAAIPEALPTVVQVILSLGAVGLAKRNAIVKDLASVETLGSTSAINSDKTGTLTMNQMTVVEVLDALDRYTVTGSGYELEGQIQHVAGTSPSIDDVILPFLVASDAKLVGGKVVGDPTEGALLVLGAKAKVDVDVTRTRYPRLATLPFDPSAKLMAAFADTTDASGKAVVRCFVKGAAPAIMERTGSALAGDGPVGWDEEKQKRTQAEVERMESAGLRVMAAATRDLDPASFDPGGDLLGYVQDVRLTSLVGMIDPPRESSHAAVTAAQAAHIRVRMITGDDVITGAAIAKQLGIPGEAILGADFAALPEDERLRRIDDIGVVGRVAPEHKALLAETLKKKGDVVAMTGDGVNDAPAIKAADIGIAMGSGTEVAKNAGRMILSDDNFATIVFAVEQGRKLYDNLLKYVRFILITLVAFVISFLGASLLNIAAGQPFTPVQILWINFLIDMPLGIALGFDAETPGLMKRRPRPRDKGILDGPVLLMSLLTGGFMAVVLLALIRYGVDEKGSLATGVTLALTAFAWFRVVGTYESRSMTETAVRLASFDCKQINRIALGEIVLAFLVAEWDVLNRLLGTKPIGFEEWLLAVAPAVVMLVLWEIGKAIARAATHDKPEAAPAGAPAPPAPATPGDGG